MCPFAFPTKPKTFGSFFALHFQANQNQSIPLPPANHTPTLRHEVSAQLELNDIPESAHERESSE